MFYMCSGEKWLLSKEKQNYYRVSLIYSPCNSPYEKSYAIGNIVPIEILMNGVSLIQA